MTAIAPNPHSPYADADPTARHLLPSPAFLPKPTPGALTVTGCLRLAVVPEEPLRSALSGGPTWPEGICEACIAAFNAEMAGETYQDHRPLTECSECDSLTHHDGLCALCRQEKHEAWWPTREQQPTA